MIRSLLPAALAALALAVPPAIADVDDVLDTQILPRIDALDISAAGLADAAAGTCDPELLRPLWSDTFDAWTAVSHLRIGPLEADAQAIEFWPDDRDYVARGLRLLGRGEIDEQTVARASVAARGLMALERLLWSDGPDDADGADATCPAVRALTADLATTTARVRDGWAGPDGFARTMRTAGDPGNTRFLSTDEVEAALYTALLTGLYVTSDQRIGRPLGSFDEPRPGRAEAWRSASSARAIAVSLTALRDLATALRPAPETATAFERAIGQARALDDPDLSGVADPTGRLRVEALQSSVEAATRVAGQEIGTTLEVPVNFNSLDGD